MISGSVTPRLEAIIPIRLRGPHGDERPIEAVLDTGYTASLTISPTLVNDLRLICRSAGNASLADGSTRRFGIYEVEIDWEGKWRTILASSIGDEALIGMRLLAGYELRIEVKAGGTVQLSLLA